MDTTERMNIGNTIWRQLPVMTKMACGMREPKVGENGELTVKVGRAMTWLTVSLNGRDYYDVELYRFKRSTWERVTLETATDVDCESLSEVVYHMVNK